MNDISKAVRKSNEVPAKTKIRGKHVQYCRYCGEAMDGNAGFCPSCGRATRGRMAPYLTETEPKDARPLQEISAEAVSDEVVAEAQNAPQYAPESYSPAAKKKPYKKMLIIAGVVVLLIGAILLTNVLIKKAAYNDMVYVYDSIISRESDSNKTSIGGESVFAIKKLWSTFYYRIEGGKPVSCKSSDISASASPVSAKEGKVSYTLYRAYTNEELAAQNKEHALSHARRIYSNYAQATGSSIPKGSVIAVKTSDKTYYFMVEKNGVRSKAATKDDIPQKRKTLSSKNTSFLPNDVTIYVPKKD